MAKKVNPGDKLAYPAGFYNEQVDAIRWIKGQQLPQGRGSLREVHDAGIVLIRNDSAATIDRFGILGITGVMIDEDTNPEQFKARIALTGDDPATADHFGKFAIAQQPIAADKMGLAVISGISVVQLNVADADHQFADVTDGDASELTTVAHGGAEILWQEAGTGTGKWAVVRIGRRVGPASHIFAQVNGAVADSDETITIDHVSIMQPIGATTYPETGTTAPTQIPNTHAGALDDDAWIQAIWDWTAAEWKPYAGDCLA